MIDLIVLSAIVLGLIQVIKITVGIVPRWIPLSALIVTFGIIFLYVWIKQIPLTWEFIENGFMVALSAVGLWSGVKATSGN